MFILSIFKLGPAGRRTVESSWIVAYHTLDSVVLCAVFCIWFPRWRGYVDRIKKRKRKEREKEKKITGQKKVRRPIHDFQAILVEAFSLAWVVRAVNTSATTLCLFSSLLISSSFLPFFFLFTISFCFSSLTLISYSFLQHSFPTSISIPTWRPLFFSLNQPVRNTGTASLSISISQGTNKQTDSLYSLYSRISLPFGHYKQDRFFSFLKPAMTEVSNTRLYLGNLPRNGMLAHPSTTTTNTITTVIASSWEAHVYARWIGSLAMSDLGCAARNRIPAGFVGWSISPTICISSVCARLRAGSERRAFLPCSKKKRKILDTVWQS